MQRRLYAPLAGLLAGLLALCVLRRALDQGEPPSTLPLVESPLADAVAEELQSSAAEAVSQQEPEDAVPPAVVVSDTTAATALISGGAPVTAGGRRFPSVGATAEPFMAGRAAEAVKAAFQHAWGAYEAYAWGADELHPVSRRGGEWFGLGLAIVDSLDTMLLMGLADEYAKARSWVQQNLHSKLAVAGDVNFFEATIRVLGGLLAAHTLGGDPEYLDLAEDTGRRLVPAFRSPSGVPLSDVSLSTGAAHGPNWGGSSSTSEVSTVQLEFRCLAALSGRDAEFRVPADKAEKAVIQAAKRQGYGGIAPMFIDPNSGTFDMSTYTLGARGDSYFEYLLKLWVQAGGANRQPESEFGEDTGLDRNYLLAAYLEATESIRERMLRVSPGGGRLDSCAASQARTGLSCGDVGPDEPAHQLLYVAELTSTMQVSHKMDHLACFYPGVLALGWAHGLGRHPEDPLRDHLELAKRLAYTCAVMYRDTSTGLAPEIVFFRADGEDVGDDTGRNRYGERKFSSMYIKSNDAFSLLRPEVVESFFVLFRVTGDERYRRWGWDVFQAMEQYAKVQPLGYSSMDGIDSEQPRSQDKMETFFLAETLKYLYLLFSPDSALDLDKFVLNTEAHPLPVLQAVRDPEPH